MQLNCNMQHHLSEAQPVKREIGSSCRRCALTRDTKTQGSLARAWSLEIWYLEVLQPDFELALEKRTVCTAQKAQKV